MINEEKANQLHPYCPIYNDFAIEKQDVNSEVRTGFIEGANWKDQQFKEYLEKKKEELFNTNYLSVLPFLEFIDEIINELFGGE